MNTYSEDKIECIFLLFQHRKYEKSKGENRLTVASSEPEAKASPLG